MQPSEDSSWYDHHEQTQVLCSHNVHWSFSSSIPARIDYYWTFVLWPQFDRPFLWSIPLTDTGVYWYEVWGPYHWRLDVLFDLCCFGDFLNHILILSTFRTWSPEDNTYHLHVHSHMIIVFEPSIPSHRLCPQGWFLHWCQEICSVLFHDFHFVHPPRLCTVKHSQKNIMRKEKFKTELPAVRVLCSFLVYP